MFRPSLDVKLLHTVFQSMARFSPVWRSGMARVIRTLVFIDQSSAMWCSVTVMKLCVELDVHVSVVMAAEDTDSISVDRASLSVIVAEFSIVSCCDRERHSPELRYPSDAETHHPPPSSVVDSRRRSCLRWPWLQILYSSSWTAFARSHQQNPVSCHLK